MKHVTSYDPRKKQIVEAFRRKSGGTKITNITETKDGFKARALRPRVGEKKLDEFRNYHLWEFIGEFMITKAEAGLDNDTEEEKEYMNLQAGINDGSVWKMEGSSGRYAMGAINAGLVMLGIEPRLDYYGNMVPSRTAVLEGTRGSRKFVSDTKGYAWLKKMESVK